MFCRCDIRYDMSKKRESRCASISGALGLKTLRSLLARAPFH